MATRTETSLDRVTEISDSVLWLTVSMLAVGSVTLAYILTHGHPAFEGGLFLEIVQQIQRHGYGLPTRIPGYTADGIPFAYPPLQFYVMAVLTDLTGADPVWLMTVFPGFFVLVSLVPFFYLSRELLQSTHRAGFATLFFGVAPPVLRWHLSAGGVVRAPAMVIVLTGLYTGLKLFRTGENRWLVASTVLWTLMVLSHPVYATFFGGTYVLFYLFEDRSLHGLLRGATVAISGLVFTAPWWLTVISRHGIDVYLTASNSRSTIGGGAQKLINHFYWPFIPVDTISLFFLLVFVALGYAILRRRFFLPVWLLSGAYLLGKWRFTFVAGSMLVAMFVFDVFVPAARRVGGTVDRHRVAAMALVALLAVGSTGLGVAFAASELDAAHMESPTMPETVDPADREAMAWAEQHTAESAQFLVMGDAAEWFPYYTDRAILVSPWGTEWSQSYHTQLATYLTASSCQDIACVESDLGSVEGDAEYLYVPAHEYTVEGQVHPPPEPLIEALLESDRYHLRYANQGVMIFEVVDQGSGEDSKASGNAEKESQSGATDRTARSEERESVSQSLPARNSPR